MGTYVTARNCDSALLVRTDRLGEVEPYVRERRLLYAGEKLRLDEREVADGLTRVWPNVDGGESLFCGEVGYGFAGDIAAFMEALCEPGSFFEWFDEDELEFGRVLLGCDRKAHRERAGIPNPFEVERLLSAPSVPVDRVVESVEWEDIARALEIDPASVDGNTADDAVKRAVKAYRRAVDECLGDLRHDCFSEALAAALQNRERAQHREESSER